MNNYLSEAVKIVQLSDAVANGTDPVDTDGVDTLGFAGCLIVAVLGTAAANNVVAIEQGADNDADWQALAGSSTASGAKPVVIIDVQHPQDRYLRAAITRGTSTTVEQVTAILYNPTTMPTDNAASALTQLHAVDEA